MPYYVYMLLCEDGSYYTGYTNNVEQRFEEHRRGSGAKYTRIHRPLKIVCVEQCNSRSQAMKREHQIKTLTHNQKQQLATS